MIARIVILTGNHLCHNPRAYKEAETLSQAGFDVEVLGGWYSAELAARDRALIENRKWRFTPVVDWTGTGRVSQAKKRIQRGRRWLAGKCFEWLAWESGGQLGYSTRELLAAARGRKADLYIAHSEQALWVAARLRRAGHRVGVDMEDWFSEDLLPEARKRRPVNLLRDLERELLRNAVYSLCPSRAMSEALADEYGCKPPEVIYNAFSWKDRGFLDGELKDRKNRDVPSIHWYSQTIGPGRGLEDLLAALSYIKTEVEVHLRGNPTREFDAWLRASVRNEWRKRIFIHGLVSNDALLPRIAEHDIGFAGEGKYCRNKDLTISNKMLQYLLGGLAIVASDTSGQMEIAAQVKEAVLIYPTGNIEALANCLNFFLAHPDQLERAKLSSLQAAANNFCWEKSEKALIELAKNATSAS